MSVTTSFSVNGSRFYHASDALKNGTLAVGAGIRLIHQPENPHDKNAVAVLLEQTGSMLGHVPRDLAPRYASLLNRGHIEASVASVSQLSGNIELVIRVSYQKPDEDRAPKSEQLPSTPGIYVIRHDATDIVYVGQSNNIRERWKAHETALVKKRHSNSKLQKACLDSGITGFTVQVHSLCPPNLSAVEKQRWLRHAESATVKEYRAKGFTANLVEPGIVINKAAKEDISAQRRTVKAALDKLQRETAPHQEQLRAMLDEIKRREDVLERSTGWRSFISIFFGSPTTVSVEVQRAELAKLTSAANGLRERLSPVEKEIANLHRQYCDWHYLIPNDPANPRILVEREHAATHRQSPQVSRSDSKLSHAINIATDASLGETIQSECRIIAEKFWKDHPSADKLQSAFNSNRDHSEEELIAILVNMVDQRRNLDREHGNDSTPLEYAARNGYTLAAAFLIKNGANLNMPNRYGLRPLSIAYQNNNDEMVSLLQANGAKY